MAVLHLPALPGAPGLNSGAHLPVAEIARAAAEDARLIAECGFTAVLVENFHDAPFLPGAVEPETVAALAVITRAVVEAVEIPVGVNVLRNDALAALGVAVAAGASFLRVNVLCGAAVTDQGLVQGNAHHLIRRRRALGADVAILADVDVKHATSLDTRPLEHRARDLVTRGGADAVLVTGHATGQPADESALRTVREAVAPCATLVASGTTEESLPALLRASDGVIVGTCLKDPDTGRVDPERAAALVQRTRS